jgi:hypothetical protein
MINHNISETPNDSIIKKRKIFGETLEVFISKMQRIISNPSVAFIVFFILMFGLFNMVSLKAGDDQAYAKSYLTFSLPEFLTMRYHTWTGRFFCETLLYYFTGPIQFLWKWLCASGITISAFVIYRFVIFAKNMGEKEKILFAYLSCFSVMLINSNNLVPSVFWTTGALNFVVPFTFSLIAFIPFFNVLKNQDFHPRNAAFLYMIPAMLTAVGNEQISLCFISFSMFVLIFLLAKKRKVPAVLWSIFISALVLQIISITAPGNIVRLHTEIGLYFPTYNQISIFRRISLSLHFLLNTIINQWYLLLFFVWLISAKLLLKKNASGISRILASISLFFAILIGLRFILTIDTGISEEFNIQYSKLFEFHYLTRSTLFLPENFIPYAVWTIAIIIIPLSIILIFKKSDYSLFYICIFLEVMASITLVTFTPSLYVSSGRTSFTSNMLLIILILFLLRHDSLLKDFALPIMVITLLKLLMFYSSWFIGGYQLFFGVIDTREIPFLVFGN